MSSYAAQSTEDLVAAYRHLGGLARAVEVERLVILAVLVEREAFVVDGCLDPASWVAANDMVPIGDARAAVATAVRLEELPAVRSVAAAGGVSMAQLVPLVELADPASDAEWAEKGPGMTPAALAALAREQRAVSREQTERQHARRNVRWWKDRHGLGYRIAGLLPDEAAPTVIDALTRRAEAMRPAEGEPWEPFEQRCAQALVEQCAADLGDAGVPELIVHVPVGIAHQQPTLPDGTPVSIDVIRRLACDATFWLLVENPDGTVAGYGRARRLPPPKMRARITKRDRKRCRWYGCTRTRGLRVHHMDEWIADLGETEEDNLILLCPAHHRLCHDGGWKASGEPNLPDGLTFTRGTTELRAPPARAPDHLLRRYGLGDAA